MSATPGLITQIGAARSLLFVPGDRDDRFDKAMAAGADTVIMDLEDSVAPADKEVARAAVAAWLDVDRPVVVRINAADTPWFEADLDLCDHPGVAAILLPKAVAGATLERVARVRPTIALVETALGILEMPAIARTARIIRLAFGALDLALDLETSVSDRPFDPLRLQMVIASRAAGLPAPIDGVTRDFRDPAETQMDMAHACRLGLRGKLCIHPAQISPTHAALRPSPEQLALAQRIVAADIEAAGAAVSIDGLMVDRPVVQRARALLDRAVATGDVRGVTAEWLGSDLGE